MEGSPAHGPIRVPSYDKSAPINGQIAMTTFSELEKADGDGPVKKQPKAQKPVNPVERSC
jgi:hypothetical protein